MVTLGTKIDPWLQQANTVNQARAIVAGTIVLEFLKNAIGFVTDLVREQAEKEEYETLDPQFIALPPFGVAAPPKLLREAIRLDNTLAIKILPVILEKLNASKIEVTAQEQGITPLYIHSGIFSSVAKSPEKREKIICPPKPPLNIPIGNMP